ncbi:MULTISPECIES: NAD(P)/FAD-dependent oxidoreductase [Halorubrum]|uniref:Thioredoxin reductase (NADPH) n=1 Tax=Halorubrum sodomense TaxID=35743 RepID=A0A1I6GDM0_HALSD|nr:MULTISPECIES: NAD(P)/FAD-dependent oxidoreductase [Halorubrum]TKX55263.1 thioredoxin-disulfide reductase [Halorubrum sp. SP3]TKX68568.1 thioredoxin-disulfide reductase [Halorubrum sp. SP9]SFR40221.1 thioredoxin reductase (NADPH) [Halorubrum sodomense]
MSSSDDEYEIAVVGGGPAGLTTALYGARLGHETVLIDRGGGRAAMMADTHNVIGVTEDVSGNELLATGREQVESYGGTFVQDFVTDAVETDDGRFRLTTSDDEILADRVVLATGFSDERPDPPLPRNAKGLHWCLHCDAYMFVDEPVYVMGHGEAAAHVAMIMLNMTDDVDLLTRGAEPTWSDETAAQLEAHPVEIVHEDVTGIENDPDSGWLEAMEFEDGTRREYRGGFPMYGSDYNTSLAEGLGCDLTDGGEVDVDDHGRTSEDGVFAVGDVTPGHNQVPVAMGQGAKAGIALHKSLRDFPRSTEEIARDGPVDADEVPAIPPDLMATAVAHEGHAGGPRTEVAETDDAEAPAADDD